MTVMLCLIPAALAWLLTVLWTKHQLSLTVESLDAEIRFWRQQAEAASANVARLARDATVREESWRQGRDAMLAVLALLRARSADGESPPGQERDAA